MKYRELCLPPVADPLAVVSALGATSFLTQYVVYERGGSWSIAEGSVAEVVLTRTELLTRTWGPDGAETRTAWSEQPLAMVGQALAESGLGAWTAYGWASFELAHALSDRMDLVPAGPLLHLIIPRVEITLDAAAVRIRGWDENLDGIGAIICAATRAPDRPTAAAAIGGEAEVADGFAEHVSQAVADIADGGLTKVVLSRAVSVAGPVDLAATFVQGRRANNPMRSFLLDLGGWQAAGFSPETIAEVDADGGVSVQVLAGTRSCGAGIERDALGRAELETDPKEVFEHVSSVKLACEELNQICAPGTTRVSDFMQVAERGSVQHLSSRVTGRLAAGRTAWDALHILFPAVTVSGIPKRAALAKIAELDGERGLYAGAVLTADSSGALDAAPALRGIFQRDGHAWMRAGAGIVAGSRAAREHEETREKLASIAPYVVPAA